jgi:hypothetical protein
MLTWRWNLARKETDAGRASQQNRERVEGLAEQGHRFRSFLEWEACWYLETFQFLKGRSRVIALADYRLEKTLVLCGPASRTHRRIGAGDWLGAVGAPGIETETASARLPVLTK